MTTVYEPFTEDENLENLLEDVAEANPDADEVMEHVYRGQSMDEIQVFGVNSDEVELPEQTHGFELTVRQPWWRHEDVDQERKQKVADSDPQFDVEEFEGPQDPAFIGFAKTNGGE